MKSQSPSNRPIYQSILSGRYTYRQVITAIRQYTGYGQMEAEMEFNRALFAGELRRVWPDINDLSEKPALYEVAK